MFIYDDGFVVFNDMLKEETPKHIFSHITIYSIFIKHKINNQNKTNPYYTISYKSLFSPVAL